MVQMASELRAATYGFVTDGPRAPWVTAPTFHTRALREAQDHLRRFEASTALDILYPSAFSGYCESRVEIGQIVLSKTTIGSPDGYELAFRPVDQYCLNIPLKGQGWISSGSEVIELRAEQAVFVAPGCAVQKHWSGPSEVLTIHVPARRLLEWPDALPAGMARLAVVDPVSVRSMLALLSSVSGFAQDRSRLMHPSVATHIENAILALLIRILPGRSEEASSAISAAAPYYIRRAEQYMRANFRPGRQSLGDIAAAAGVSRRTLQYGFKHFKGSTPTQYFRRMRLEHARSALMNGRGKNALTQIAWEVGYQNSSHFSGDYRAEFGESPSSTLARSGVALTASVLA